MAVYVDRANIPYPRSAPGGKKPFRQMKMCHMAADSLDELHAMADKIGMKREWFQGHTRYPHYDINLTKKTLALKEGAIEVSSKELVLILREQKKAPEMEASA